MLLRSSDCPEPFKESCVTGVVSHVYYRFRKKTMILSSIFRYSLVSLLFCIMVTLMVSCLHLEPNEEEMIVIAEDFAINLDIDLINAEHDVIIVQWYDDAMPSSYIISYYDYVESNETMEGKIRARLGSEHGWIFKNAGDEWLMKTLTDFNAFCATMQLVNGDIIHSSFDNAITMYDNQKLKIKLYHNSPPNCLLKSNIR